MICVHYKKYGKKTRGTDKEEEEKEKEEELEQHTETKEQR